LEKANRDFFWWVLDGSTGEDARRSIDIVKTRISGNRSLACASNREGDNGPRVNVALILFHLL
jgi:hypothetical protein